jgi:hypothetical protein
VDEDEFETLRRWGEGLEGDARPEIRAAGKAIRMLAEEVEKLQVELWNARLGIQASAAPPEEPEPAEAAATGEVQSDLRNEAHRILERMGRAAKRLQSARPFQKG